MSVSGAVSAEQKQQHSLITIREHHSVMQHAIGVQLILELVLPPSKCPIDMYK